MDFYVASALTLVVSRALAYEYVPVAFPDKTFYHQLQVTQHIKDMSAEIFADVTQKLTVADKLREIHQKSITFELGAIAAGLMERYWKMIHIYKKYANLQELYANKYKEKQIYDAYLVLRGLYFEIRLEKKLFEEIRKKHESTRPPRRLTIPQYMKTTEKYAPHIYYDIPPGFAQQHPEIMEAMREPQQWSPPKK